MTQQHYFTSGVSVAFVKHDKSPNNSSKAAVSITLNHGHFSCDSYPEGFAHLFEHMLFTASTKYTNTDALDAHLLKHHGQVNGWTQDLATTIQLNCEPSGFLDAIDMLLDRLFAPLFTEYDIQREIIAIDAEFKSKKDDPVRQLLSVQRETCNPKHPFSRFSVGNAHSLNQLNTNETQKLLHQYHQQIMQGQNISVAIGLVETQSDQVARILLDKIEQFAQRNKAKFKRNSIAIQKFPTLFLCKHLSKLISIKQDSPRHQLIVSYIINNADNSPFSDCKNSLYNMLSHLLESQHEGSLCYHLKQLKMVSGIQSYYRALDPSTDEWVISLELSDYGATKPNDIYSIIQAYINYLRDSGIEAWRFREKESQFALHEHIKPKNSLLEDCIHLSHHLSNTTLTKSTLTNTINAEESAESNDLVSNLVTQLPPLFAVLQQSNSRVYFLSATVLTNAITPHYDVAYQLEALRNVQPVKIRTCFAKPRKNPYIANQYPVHKAQLPPTQLLQLISPQVNLKFYQDTRLGLPNGECYISITEPLMYQTPQKIAIKRVWLSCLNEYLNRKFFDLELASMHFRVYAHSHGVSIHTGGLSERQLLLCIELINEVRGFKADIANIAHHLDEHISRIQNMPKQRFLNQLFADLNQYYQTQDSNQDAVNAALLMLSPEEIKQHQESYFNANYVESLLIGNWNCICAERFFKQLNARFNAQQGLSKPSFSAPYVKSAKHTHRQGETEDTHFIWHYIPLNNDIEEASINHQSGLKLTLAARSLVLEKLLSHTLFKVIRQKYNMAYTLGVGYKPISRFPGIAIYVVSPTHDTRQIKTACDEVIDNCMTLLCSDKMLLAEVIVELIRQVTPRERDIGQTARRTWLHFEDDNPILGYQALIDALQALKSDEIMSSLINLRNTSRGQIILTMADQNISDVKLADQARLEPLKRVAVR